MSEEKQMTKEKQVELVNNMFFEGKISPQTCILLTSFVHYAFKENKISDDKRKTSRIGQQYLL